MNYTALDTSALSWLLPELKAGLSKVRADLMQAQNDLSAASLHPAKASVHEAAGALQIMDAKGLIQFAQALEGAFNFLIEHSNEITQDSLDMLDEACNALIAYLEEIQISSEFAQPLVLYAYYEDLHTLQGTQRYHAADLYFPPLSARFKLPASSQELGADELKRARRSFEHHLLPVLKDHATSSDYQGLKDTLAKVAAAQSNAQTYTFWCCCEAVLETLVEQSSQAEWLDLDVKRWIARINLQLRRLAEGSPQIAERLYREALYFIAHHATQSQGARLSPDLLRIGEAFKLAGSVPAVLSSRPYRRLDETKLSQVKHAVKSLKVLLDEAVHHQDASDGVTRSSVLFEQRFTQARKELQALVVYLKDLSLKEVSLLADALAQVLAKEVEKSPVLTSQMSIQAASTLLLIEHSVTHSGAASMAAIKHRTQNLQAFAQGLIELTELNQSDVRDSEIDGLVGGQGMDEFGLNEALTREITGLMAGVEKNLDNYFRNPTDTSSLSSCIAPLAQLESSFGMIELPAAMRSAQHVLAQVKRFMQQSGADNSHLFAPLAQEFGSLSVLIELFGKNPSHARLHFSYDESSQKLIEMSTADAGIDQKNQFKEQNSPFESVEALAAQRQNEAQALMRAYIAKPTDASTKLALEQSLKALKVDAELIGDDALGELASTQLAQLTANTLASPTQLSDVASQTVSSQASEALIISFPEIGGLLNDSKLASVTLPASLPELPAMHAVPVAQAPADTDDDMLSFEQEMLQTFLEEAQEVLSILKPRLLTLRESPANHACLNHVRRAFHTLKGSGRMVNLNALGNAAWAIEQRLNEVLTVHAPVPAQLLNDLDWAHDHLLDWINDLQAHGQSGATAAQCLERFAIKPVAEAEIIAPKADAVEAIPALKVEPLAVQAQSISSTAASILPALPSHAEEVKLSPLVPNAGLASASSVRGEPTQPPSALPPDSVQKKPTISLVTDNSARLAQDFVVKPMEPRSLSKDPASVPFRPAAPAPAGIKVVGPIKLPAPLYAIYITESAEHIAALEKDLKAWAAQPDTGCSYEAYRFAHSLKGGAATVGFGTLRDIASSLEGVLDLSHKRNLALSASQFALVNDTVRQLRAMHGEFAQGNYPSGDYNMVVALSQLCNVLNAEPALNALEPEDAPAQSPAKALHAAQEMQKITVGSSLQAQDEIEKVSSPNASIAKKTLPLSSELDEFASMLGSFSIPPAPAPAPKPLMAEAPRISMQPISERANLAEPMQPAALSAASKPSVETASLLTAQAGNAPAYPPDLQAQELGANEDAVAAQLALLDDEIEASILPDFIEEANELMPQCAQWLMDLEHNASQAAELRRGLHTLKGGARMAGAMKLGAVLHILESDVESLLVNTLAASLPESAHLRLIDLFDRAQYLYDVLTGRVSVQDDQNKQSKQNLQDAATPAAQASHALHEVAATEFVRIEAVPAPQGQLKAAGPAETPSAVATSSQAAAAPQVVKADVAASVPAADLALAAAPATVARPSPAPASNAMASLPAIRLRTDTLDRLVNQAGEVTSNRARLDQHVVQLRSSLKDLTDNVERIRSQLREVEIQAESQMNTRLEQTKVSDSQFDPLEFDRFTRFQELTRMLAESLSDMVSMRDSVATTLTLAERDLSEQSKLTRDMTQSLMRTRLVQFDAVSDRLYRVARQAAKDLGKQVELDIQGGTVELDRSILERMTAPLEHLVRNCLAHGIELPAQRLAAGKSSAGHIVVATRQVGNEIELTVQDDGAGLDLNRIRLQAVAKGLLAADAMPGHAQLAEMIFVPGFSTAAEVTQISGRGVGMDVVRSEAAALGGRVNIEMLSLSGGNAGSKFVIRLPLTLAVNQVLLVRAANAVFAVPAALIESLSSITTEQLGSAYQARRLEQRNHSYPFAYLGGLLELAQLPASSTQRSAQVLLIHSGNERVAVHIDAVIGNQEVVVKNIGNMLSRIQGINSATVLGGGELCLIIDPGQLWLRQSALHNAFVSLDQLATAATQSAPQLLAAPVQAAAIAAPSRKLAMVVDDSLTVRKVTQRLLARENWQVVLAKDGVDALEQLQSLVPDVMLVDIEMPRMDGFDLTRNVRADERLAQVPIIMITSRMADKHKQYAKELGVNAYLGKPYHDDELLDNMTRLTAH